MTLATSMMFPSSFLQNVYVDLVEYEKDSSLYEPLPIQTAPRTDLEEDAVDSLLSTSETHRQPFELAVRITSLAHAALQFVCAAIETVPLLAVTTATVLFNASNSGFFSRDGGRIERVVAAALAALASVWFPVGTSLWAVLNPSDLSNEDSSIQYQFIARAFLFSFTLPSLPRLANFLDPDTKGTLETSLRGGAAASGEETGTRERDALLLEQADDEAFEWRTNLARRLANRAKQNTAHISGLDVSFSDLDVLSFSFAYNLREAVKDAARSPSASASSPAAPASY